MSQILQNSTGLAQQLKTVEAEILEPALREKN
jgi:hypothetical protein